MNEYAVWFDLLMEDYFAIQKKDMTDKFKAQLDHEKVKIKFVSADSTIEAINMTFPKIGKHLQNSTFH